jgi:hypothetical protein
MTNIQFPSTNLVECVFSWRQNATYAAAKWDEYDHCDPAGMKRYIYRLPDNLVGKVAIGDTVLVHCKTGYQLAQITTINALASFNLDSVAPVVCLVNLGSYIAEVERKKSLARLKQQLDAEKKRLESMVTYDLIAEKNPEFKALLDAYRAAGGEF